MKKDNMEEPLNFNNSSISILQDSYQDISSAMVNNYIAQRYAFSVVNTQCSKDNLWVFLDKLKEKYNELNILNNKFELSPTNRLYYIEDTKNTFLIVADISAGNGELFNINIFGKNVKIASEVYQEFKEFEHEHDEVDIQFITVGVNNGKASEVRSRLTHKDFEDDSSDYYPYLDTNSLFEQFVRSNENILLLVGAPGVGKSRLANMFMRWMLDNADVCTELKMNEKMIEELEDMINITFSVSYVKNEEILAMDDYWNKLSTNNHALVFLDDADFSLTSRKNSINGVEDLNKNKFLSQLLSFTDGITKNNTKFIITTNIEVDDIDTAILRKGRTFDILNLRYLSQSEAKNIWEKQGFDIQRFHDNLGDQEIPACDLGSAINKEKIRLSNGIKPKSYLLEDGISILGKETQKLGFI